MSLYLHELGRARRGLMLWSLCQAALIGMGYLEFVLVFRGNTYVAQLLREMPQLLMAMMGTAQGVDFSVVGDFFYAMADFGFYVMAAYACLLGFRVVSREEEEFLHSRPVTRAGVLLCKCGAGATCCLVLGGVTVLAAALTFGRDPGGDLGGVTLVWGGTSVLLMLVYFLVGVLFAAAFRRRGLGSALNLLVLVGTVLMSRLVGFLALTGPVVALSAKDYFPVHQYVATGSFGLWPWVMCGVWCVLLLGLSLWRYGQRDL